MNETKRSRPGSVQFSLLDAVAGARHDANEKATSKLCSASPDCRASPEKSEISQGSRVFQFPAVRHAELPQFGMLVSE